MISHSVLKMVQSTIMGKTDNLTVVQKTLTTREVNHRRSPLKGLADCYMETIYRKTIDWRRKCAAVKGEQATGMTAALTGLSRKADSRTYGSFARRWTESVHQEPSVSFLVSNH